MKAIFSNDRFGFKIVDMSVGVHVDKRVEEVGLDIYEHG